MNREIFNLSVEALDENLVLKTKKQAEIYDEFYDMLNDIVSYDFYDLNSGKLVILPVGDYISQTLSESSIVEYLIIYQTSKSMVDFAVINQKITRKGKKKLSTMQSLIGRPTEKGTMQAEDVAERIAYNLRNELSASKFVFQKRNEIVIKYADTSIKITVVYDFNENKNDTKLTQRYINRWQKINPVKYLDKIEQKDAETGGNYRFFVKFFKALEIELILAKQSNLYIGKNAFVENLLYNIPSELFVGEANEVILEKLIVYLNNIDFSNFELIDETGKMFELKYNKNYAKQFINKITYISENFEKILEFSLQNNDKNND